MSNLSENTRVILDSVKDYPKATVICASKYLTAPMMDEIYHAGIRHFGENHAQALLDKQNKLTLPDICWHFIGHLQTNKVKQIINQIEYLHSLDRIKLAEAIQTYRILPLNCFIEVNLGEEDTKTGIHPSDLTNFIQALKKYDKINVVGLMAMGILDDVSKTQTIFKTLVSLKETHQLKYVSMGMTDDYLMALSLGSDFVRVGRKFIL